MKRVALFAAVLLVGAVLPMATAKHLSVGSITTVGMDAQEFPHDPSVNGTWEDRGDKSTPYGVATSTDCYNADAEVSADEALAAAAAEDVCGELVYNKNVDNLTRLSPPDQHMPDQRENGIGTFDVQVAYSHACGFCWRSDYFLGYNPTIGGQEIEIGNTTWDAFHTAGALAGVTDPPDNASEQEGDRYQIITQDVSTPNAFQVVQEETGLWKMNGWNGPPPTMQRVVAFIYNDDGTVFTPDDLRDGIKNNNMDEDTKEEICGFRAGAEYSSGQALTFCQTYLRFQGQADEDNDPTYLDGYNEKCNSPAYFCAEEGPYWRSNNVGLLWTFGGQQTQDDVVAYHWVVAPNPHDCPNISPGRLSFGYHDTADVPYLAHDLDVYTTATDFRNVQHASIDGTTDYAESFQDETPSVPGLPPQVDETIQTAEDTRDETTQVFVKDDTVEPNNGDPVAGGLEDSRTDINEERGVPGDCESLIDTETEQTRDPWVNIVDGQVDGLHDDSDGRVGASVFGYGGSVKLPDAIDAYGTSDDSQDASNRPGPSLFATEGKIGVFADRNDDGDYDQVAGGTGVWQSDDIQETGAYPMMWDMNVNDSAAPQNPQNAGGGCPTGPGGSFSSEMEKAGYGPNTALAQAIYLREPTVFADIGTDNTETVEYPAGNNIYLLGNDAARQLWNGTEDGQLDATDNPVDGAIDGLVKDLRTYVSTEHGADESSIEVYVPGEELGVGSSDFASQCGQATGGFSSQLSFLHYCQGEGPVSCKGDTIATMYTFEVNGTEAHPDTLGGGESQVPLFKVNGTTYQFGDEKRQHTWYDVDPFDNDPSRNAPENAPPTGEN